MNWSTYSDKRVVMTCENNLSYAGIFKGMYKPKGDREYVRVEVDPKSGFSVLSPVDFVQKITIIPIKVDENA